MNSQSLFQRLNAALTPTVSAKKRVKSAVLAQINPPALLEQAIAAAQPPRAAKARVWRLIESTFSVTAVSWLTSLKNLLSPKSSQQTALWQQLQARLNPVAPTTAIGFSPYKWTAAFVVVAMLVQFGPSYFVAPTTVAESKVVLRPIKGEVSINVGNLREQVAIGKDLELQPGVQIFTGPDSAATLVFRDDAVLRLDENTRLAIHDTTPRLEPATEVVSTFTLAEGRVWAQGLIPSTMRGITISSSFGNITVHEGSASVESRPDEVEVTVWDRHATVAHQGKMKTLSLGEQTHLRERNALLIKEFSRDQFDEEYARVNLAKDAVHRRYIAHLQHERLVALAGILPTDARYPVKRLIEDVDTFFTSGEQAEAEKVLELANTRRNEAAALLAKGEVDAAEEVLSEYRAHLISLIKSESDDAELQFLVKQSLAEMQADIAAAQPGDVGYPLKEEVLKLSTAVPHDVSDAMVAQTTLFLDTLSTLTATASEGEPAEAKAAWLELQSYLALIEKADSPVDPAVRKEVNLLLERFAEAVEARSDEFSKLDPELVDDVIAYLPTIEKDIPPITAPRTVRLSDEQIDGIADAIMRRTYETYTQPVPRRNQLQFEITAIQGPDRGRILRRVLAKLPEQSRLRLLVRREIAELQEQVAGETQL